MHLAGTREKYSRFLVTWSLAVGFVLMLGLPQISHQKLPSKTPKQWARLLTAHPTESKNVPPSLGPALVPHLIDEIQRDSKSLPDLAMSAGKRRQL